MALAAGCSSGSAKAPPSEPLDHDVATAAAAAGQKAFARGAYDAAAEQYRRALMRARLQDDPALIGDQAFNIAVCQAALGDANGAAAHLAEAEAALRRPGLPLADVLLVGARLAYRRSAAHADATTALDEALAAAAARVLDDPQSRPTAMHEGEVALVRAEIACDRRDAGAAAEHLDRARRLGAPRPGAPLAAGLARATGQVAALRGQADAAARSFDEEAGLQRRARRYPDMAKALLRAAAAHADAAPPDVAADRYDRAALSLSFRRRPLRRWPRSTPHWPRRSRPPTRPSRNSSRTCGRSWRRKHDALPPAWVRARDLISLRVGFRAARGGDELTALIPRARALIGAVPQDERPTVARAHQLLATLHLRLGRYEQAEESLARALEAIEDEAPSKVWILDGFGQVLMAQGVWQEARRIFAGEIRMKADAGDLLGVAITAGHLTTLELRLGLPEAAEAVVRAADESRALRTLLGEVDAPTSAHRGQHHLIGVACLALARAAATAGDAAATVDGLTRAGSSFTLPSDQALVRYREGRLFPDRAGDQWLASMQSLFGAGEVVSEAGVLTHVLLAEHAAGLRQSSTEEATIIFADLVGFTARSTKMTAPEVMATCRSLFELSVPLQRKHRVRPLAYLGDGLLALAQGDGHAARELAFARELLRQANRMTLVRRALGEPWGLTMRAGVAAGPVVLGAFVSQFRLQYTAISMTVNLASRLETAADPSEIVCEYATAA